MPIRPENKGLYPADWKTAIVPMIRVRSGDRCETCGVVNGAVIRRSLPDKRWYRYCDVLDMPNVGVRRIIDGRLRERDSSALQWSAPVTIVLTVAHLNHREADCRPENLMHWCQLDHNRHDAKQRAANAARRRWEKKGTPR